MKSRVFGVALLGAILSACNACSPAQTSAFKSSLPTDEQCVAKQVLADLQAGMSWGNTALNVVATCGEEAVVSYENALASATAASDAGSTAQPTPSLIATYRMLKAKK